MNKDQIKGTIKDVVGKLQEDGGKLIGSDEQQREGVQKQREGKAQRLIGDVKEVLEDATKK